MNRLVRHAGLLLLILPALAFGQSGAGTLQARPGERGLWLPQSAGDERLVDLDNLNSSVSNTFAIEANPLLRTPRVAGAALPDPSFKKLTMSEVPFQPWAKSLHAYRQENQLEPHTRCKPSGGPRQFLTPYGVEFLELQEMQRILIVDLGGPHTIRVIYMDGKPHPKDLDVSYLGHSVGRWEGKTLVVDSVGFNERFWFDRWGLPHTEQLHIIERFTRVDETTLRYELTIDDPGAYTRPWTTMMQLRWNSTVELFEFVCQDNNLAPELMLGASPSINRSSVIVP